GFSNHFETPADLAAIVPAGMDVPAMEAAAEKLVASANDGGGSDNITVVVVDVQGDESDRATLVEARFDALRSVFMFKELDHAMMTRVLEACRLESHEPGHVVVELGDKTGELFVVV